MEPYSDILPYYVLTSVGPINKSYPISASHEKKKQKTKQSLNL